MACGEGHNIPRTPLACCATISVETRAENLQDLPDFKGLNIPRSKGGKIDPVTDLFRTDWPGVTTGPVVSQFMLSDFLIDSIVVTPKADPLFPGMDYMMAFQPWLDVQVSITPFYKRQYRTLH